MYVSASSFLFPLGCLAALVMARTLRIYVRERSSNPKRLPLPPGPRGLPFIGNIFDLPLHKPWLVYDDRFKTYGDMVYLNVLGQGFLILGSLEKINDILDKRSTNYSDRPSMPMIVDLMHWDFSLAMLSYGPWLRRHRRTFHTHFNQGVIDRYQPIQISISRALLRNLLASPDDYKSITRLFFASLVMKIAYGIEVKDWNDKYVRNADEALTALSEAAVPGRYMVDIFPFMKYIPSWFPGAEWKRKANYYRELNRKVADEPYELVKGQMREGRASASVCTQLIEALPAEESSTRGEEETIAKNVCAVAYAAGSDTTVSAVLTFFLAMCLYPEVQQKAQAELDLVLQGRLPEFKDRPSLPYINAMIKETLRWQPVLSSGFGHSSAQPDTYNGYYIPKGTLVIGNSWSILQDPKAFNNPQAFIPERYLKLSKASTETRDPGVAAYGYGRRICPGRFFSDESSFSIIAHVLSVYNIKPGRNENGDEMTLQPDYTSTVISHPVPFPCSITPRSRVAEELIRSSEFAE